MSPLHGVFYSKKKRMPEQSHKQGIFKLFNKNILFLTFLKVSYILSVYICAPKIVRNQLFIYFFYFFVWEIYYSITYCENVISLSQNIHGFTSHVQYQQKEKYKQIKTPGECFNLHEIQMVSAFDFAFHIDLYMCVYICITYYTYIYICNKCIRSFHH